jgi:hypothetical protein
MAGIRREVGPLLLVRHFVRELGIASEVDRLLPSRGRHKLSAGEVVEALIASRLASPSPLYDVSGWASSAAMAELFGIPHQLLNDDRLGRCLEALCPHGEELRGAVMLHAIERFGAQATRLHLDLTALRVAGAYEGSALVEKGWSADRRVARKVRALQATNAQGVPLYLRPGAGSAAELTMLGAAMERLRYCSERERRLPPSERTRYRGVLRPFEVTDPDSGEQRRFRVAYIHSSEEEREVAAARERALAGATTRPRSRSTAAWPACWHRSKG